MSRKIGFILKLALIAVLAAGLAGCMGKKKEIDTGPVFFPPEPNPPRLQYLMGITDSRAVEGQKKEFVLFMAGKPEKDQIKPIVKPYGIATAKGKIYVCDTGGTNIVIIDLENKTFDYLKGNYSIGKLKKPINVEVDEDGFIFVTDTLRKEVLMYNAEGNFVRAYGKKIAGKPVDVAADREFLYILDLQDNDIKVVDRRTGRLDRSIGKTADGVQGLSIPINLTIDEKGFLYVTNAGLGNVMKLDKDGHILQTIGKMGDGFGDFGRPRGVEVDDEGRIYVADASHQNVQMFNDKGRLLIFFGDPGLVVGSMNLPAAIAVTKDNLEYFQKLAAPGFILERVVLVTNQFGPAKVAVYGLGQMQGAENLYQ